MAKYKVGDRVRIVNHRTWNMNFFGEMDKWFGKTMTIRRVIALGYLMVEDSEENCCEGWFWDDDMIAGLAEPQTERHGDNGLSVVIRFHGNKTTARLMRGETIVKTATARRNPADKYNRAEGARIAVERLFEKKRNDGKPKESKPKIGDKFVVTVKGGKFNHCFGIGDIVTLVEILKDGCFDLADKSGFAQILHPSEVRPYKEESK